MVGDEESRSVHTEAVDDRSEELSTSEKINTRNSLFSALIDGREKEELAHGLYTEIHVTDEGHLFITPENIDASIHHATVTGTHSMWDNQYARGQIIQAAKLNEGETPQLSSETMVGKGIIKKGEDESLVLILHDNNSRYAKKRGLVEYSDNIAAYLEDVAEKAKDMKILVRYVGRGKREHEGLEVKLHDRPKISTDAVFKEKMVETYESHSKICSGFATDMTVSVSKSMRKSAERLSIGRSIYIEMDIYHTNQRTHQEARSLVGRGEYGVIRGADSQQYNLTMVHTIDEINKRIDVVVQSSDYDFTKSEEGQDIEYALYYAYLRQLQKRVGINMEGYKVELRTVFGNEFYRKVEFGVEDITQKLGTSRIVESRAGTEIRKRLANATRISMA